MCQLFNLKENNFLRIIQVLDQRKVGILYICFSFFRAIYHHIKMYKLLVVDEFNTSVKIINQFCVVEPDLCKTTIQIFRYLFIICTYL